VSEAALPRAVPPPAPAVVSVGDGVTLRLRPLEPHDEAVLRYGLEHLSAQSSYQRFLSIRRGVSDAEIHYLTHPDQRHHLALGAELIGLEHEASRGVGVARSIFLPETGDMAEYAVAVADSFQGLGVGTVLLRHLADWALRTGVKRWYSVQLAENLAVLRATSKVASETERRTVADGVIEVFWKLEPQDLKR
jgi:GNAT superfamily N-acetyltransferase